MEHSSSSNRAWIAPLIVAVVVGVFGWWTSIRVRQIVETQVRAQLANTLEANATALDIWITNQISLANAIAADPSLQALALEVLANSAANEAANGPFRPSPAVDRLNALFRPRLEAAGYRIADLVDTQLNLVTTLGRGRFRPRTTVIEEHEARFAELFASGQPVLITPFRPQRPGPPGPPGSPNSGPFERGPWMRRFGDRAPLPPTNATSRTNPAPPASPDLVARDRPLGPWSESGSPPDPGDHPGPDFGTNLEAGAGPGPGWGRPFGRGSRAGSGPGPGNGPRAGPGFGLREDLTLMQVAIPLRDTNGTVRGALALVIDPEREFTRILSVARLGQSGETYAFDQRGLLISRSRFDDQLKTLGLLEDRPGVSSALRLRLSDPGRDRPSRIEPEAITNATRPLIHLVAQAVSGEGDVDLTPRRDYRGVPVVGACRWLSRHGFGVATQINAAEAFQPLRVLNLLFLILFLLLLLSALGMLLLSRASAVWQRRLSEAELRLRRLGQYTLEDKIGEGAMGVVYRARHALMRRDTAVKLLLPQRADEESIRRFEREVCLTCRLAHPNTIQVYDYGWTPDGIFYYAMEYLKGFNLQELVERFGPQSEARVVYILLQVCDALAEAHALGLVHRDIKPANVFLSHRGGIPDAVKVLDFGLVRECHAHEAEPAPAPDASGVEGTPSFMPPEAFQPGHPGDPRSDLYSVGALGYFLLTGRPVFEAETLAEVQEHHLTTPPCPPSRRTDRPVSLAMDEAMLRCLAKNPAQRPQATQELRALLLASPQAGEWTLEARAAWWARYAPLGAAPPAPEPATPSAPLTEPALTVDLAGRS